MDDSNFASLNREIADDISGTEVQPLLVNVLHGKCGSGAVFVIKIGRLYFEMYQRKKAKEWILLRCKFLQKSEKCGYTCKVINLGNLAPED